MDYSLIERMTNLAVDIQQIPSPTFAETRRAEKVRELFIDEGLTNVSVDELGNVYACLPGQGHHRPLVVSAHLDTVFPAGTDLSLQRSEQRLAGPGIGDNAFGVAGLFGLVWALQLQKKPLPGDVWLVANTGEEGLGNLQGMRQVVQRFGGQPLAYLILEGMALGQVYIRGLSVQRYRLIVQTSGGHSWVDYGRPSAVHEIAKLVISLTDLPLPASPRTTLNVGKLSGGTSVNTIAARAELELDLRCEEKATLSRLTAEVERVVKEACRPGVQVSAELIGERPSGSISPSHPLVRLAVGALQNQGIKANLNTGSTDANIPLSLGLPAICIGLTTGNGAHTLGEYIETTPVMKGLVQLLEVVEGAFQVFNP